MAVEREAFTLIQSDAELAEAARRWAEAPALGLDTEFVRTNTFYHRLGLIQVCDGSTAWLVDPLAARDLAPLAAVFRSPGVKILHSASEDIEVFYRALGVLPAPLFDTQIAGAFAGKGAFLSYQKLVAACLGVELAKEETRTDWLARPLSPGQLAYAAEDVAFLLPVYEQLCGGAGGARPALLGLRGLRRAPRHRPLRGGRRERLPADQGSRTARPPAARRAPGPGGLAREGGAPARPAAELRAEGGAAPRPRHPPAAGGEATSSACRRSIPARRRGTAPPGSSSSEQAAARPEPELPNRLSGKPFSPAAREVENRLRDRVRERAAELDVPPEILAPRRTLDALLRLNVDKPDPRLPRELEGWRREVIGEDLLREARPAAGQGS